MKFCRARDSEYPASCSYLAAQLIHKLIHLADQAFYFLEASQYFSAANKDISVVDQVYKGGVDNLLQSSDHVHLTLSCLRHNFSKARGIFMTGKRKVIYHMLYPIVNSDWSTRLF